MSQATNLQRRTPAELALLYASVRQELDQAEEILRDHLRGKDAFIDRLARHGFRLGGKRLRPALLLLSGKACGRLGPEHPLLATAMEMIHTATLIHDDVLDEATLRRHLDTVNARWDNEASVLLGDYLFTLAITLVSSLDDAFAYRAVCEAGKTMVEGELRQVGSRGNFEMGEDEYFEIIGDKTAALYACCCRLGAHYSGAEEGTRERFARYGYQLGVAFQIIDDVLDLLGDEAQTGKSLGTDLIKQKPTLPVIRLLDWAEGNAHQEILAILAGWGGHGDGAVADAREALRPWLQQSGAIDYARQKALWYVHSAIEELADVPPSPARDALLGIADFMINRQQ